MALSYNELINKLMSFHVENAVNRARAEEKLENFLNEVRPEIDQVLRENASLTAEQRAAIDERESELFAKVNARFPRANNANNAPANNAPAQGGGKRRRNKTRAANLRKRKQRKTRSCHKTRRSRRTH
jgi:hypothetical protein